MVGWGMDQYKRLNNEILKERCFEYCGRKKCKVCDTDLLPICCYDFHHKKGFKEEEISKMIQRKHKLDAELKVELDKCIVVCANCHRQITNKLIK